jgi:hypothetical protein
MHRRTFLKVVGVAGAFGLPLAGCHDVGTIDDVLRLPAFLSGICDEKTLYEIGIAFGKRFPQSYRSDILKNELMRSVLDEKQIAKTEPSRLSSLLYERVERDFHSGNVTDLKGWVLSITEARQCALYSLSIPQ